MGNDLISSLAFAASGMETQAMRLRAVSENIANADTPGYRRKVMTRIYDPGHPLADETGYYDGSNVDLVIEIADAREAQRSYEANLRMFDQTRQMTQSLFDLLRR